VIKIIFVVVLDNTRFKEHRVNIVHVYTLQASTERTLFKFEICGFEKVENVFIHTTIANGGMTQ
jgi:hypothetical protein